MKDTKVIGIIPARLGSKRFPNKAIYELEGKPLFLWPAQEAQKCKSIDKVIVATNSEEIAEIAKKNDVEVFLNQTKCSCGTERIAEYASIDDSGDYFLNIQADEVLIQDWMLDLLIERAIELESKMATIITPIFDDSELDDKNTVKVVCNRGSDALYFSRAAIPFSRHLHSQYRKHIGIYFYDRDVLAHYDQKIISQLEYAESLEQLRALENGFKIHCINIDQAAELVSVNARNDIPRIIDILNNKID
ncbi:MAG: 3-deoxy-manno-octulosonate cytidylyltransferase [Candidatus Zixiibacteriota bacterium]